jgi:hypothetical protein
VSGSLSGYRQLYDRELAHAAEIRSQEDLVHRAALRTVPDVPILFGGFHLMYVGWSTAARSAMVASACRERPRSRRLKPA